MRERLDQLDGLVEVGNIEDAVPAEAGPVKGAVADGYIAGSVGDDAGGLLVGRIQTYADPLADAEGGKGVSRCARSAQTSLPDSASFCW